MPTRAEPPMGTNGNASSIRRPARNNGCCGPGTLVVTVWTLRCGVRPATRPPSASSIEGANPLSAVSRSAATACPDSLSACICSRIDCNRATGSSIPTGSSANSAETLLLYVPRSCSARTETGTSVRTTRPSTGSPRPTRRSRNPRVIAASTTSFTVPPKLVRIVLTSARRPRAHAHRRCGPIGPFSDVAGTGHMRRRKLCIPRATCAASAAMRPGRRIAACMVRMPSYGLAMRSATARATSSTGLGSGAARGGLGPRPPPPRRRRGHRRLALAIEQDAEQVGRRYAVDHAMVDLRDHRPPAVAEPLRNPKLPQRPRAVELLGHDPPDQVAELLVASGRRQTRAAHVVVENEMRIIDPQRAPQIQRHEAHLLAIAGDERQLRVDRRPRLLVRRRRALEHSNRPDVHVGHLVLDVKERSVLRAHRVHDSSRSGASDLATLPTRDEDPYAGGQWSPRAGNTSGRGSSLGVS